MKETLRGICFRTVPQILQAVDRSIRTINTAAESYLYTYTSIEYTAAESYLYTYTSIEYVRIEHNMSFCMYLYQTVI